MGRTPALVSQPERAAWRSPQSMWLLLDALSQVGSLEGRCRVRGDLAAWAQ